MKIAVFIKSMLLFLIVFASHCSDDNDNMKILFDRPNDRLRQKTLVSIAVTPASGSVAKGLTLQYTAIGTYSDNSTADITATATWTSDDTSIATINTSGLATAVAVGTSDITATQDAISDSKTLTVTAPALVSIAVTPTSGSVAKGLTLQYTATGTYTDSSTADITATATWTSDDTLVATINASGLTTAVAEGTANITATQDGKSDSKPITVTPKVIQSIAVTPTNGSVAKGLTLQYTAIATYSDATTADITLTATWTSSAASVATINASGLATAVAAGSANITATQGGKSNSKPITVTAPVVVTITLSPASASIPDGKTVQFTATGTYSDGSTGNVTDVATWSSTSPGIASVSDVFGTKGLATGQAVGITIIQAQIGTVFGSANLTVTIKELETISVTPANASVAAGLTVQYTAIGTYTDSSTANITATVTWSSSAAPVATINASGLATAVAVGTSSIKATLGAINNSKTITVTAPVVASISISPLNQTIKAWRTLQYIAIGTYTDSSTQNITNSVTWSSSNSAKAKISNSAGSQGRATGITAGSVVITASMGAVNRTTNLTIISNVVIPENPDKIHEEAHFAVTDSMGRIILGGYAQIPGQYQDAAMWRYFHDGTLDTSFGTNGRIIWDSPMGYHDVLLTIKINPDGSIMVGGYACNNPTTPVNPSILIGKFNSNGQPDISFSPDGFKITGINNSKYMFVTMDNAFDSSGRLLTSGRPRVDASPNYDFGAIRTNISGNIDNTFATSGYFQFNSSQAPLNLAPDQSGEYASCIRVDSGNIYINGSRTTTSSAVLKLQESNGSILAARGNIPFLINPYTNQSIFISSAHIYIAGYTASNEYYAWAKLNKSDLTFVAGYGSGGSYIHNNTPGGQPNAIYVNSIGEAYIGGPQATVPQSGYVVKATSTGGVDTGWGNNGELSYSDIGFPGSSDNVSFILIHNSELVIVGQTEVMINATACKRFFLDVAPEKHFPDDKDILSFNFAASENPGLSKNVIGTVNATTIDLVVPFGTNISSLVPDIRIDGATVFPADGDAVNFSGGPVTYTVEADDSTIKNYTVTVTVSAWKGPITITINRTKVASNLTNFPVMISLPNNASLKGNAKPDGSDIYFEDETMTKLDHEIEKYDNSTGDLIAWVRVPLLSSSTDTDIYLYYGNLSSPDQSNKTGVWDTNYQTVLHMNNNPAAAGGNEIKDSSIKSNHFTNSSGLTSGDSVNAYIGKGLSLVGKAIQRTGALSKPSSVTISAWVNFTGVLPGMGGAEIVNISNIFGVRASNIWGAGGRDSFFWHQKAGDNYNGITITPPAPSPAPQSILAGTGWHHVVATFDNTGKTQKIYVDGILKASGTFAESALYEWTSFTCIGKHPWNNSYDYNGKIDETRISDIPRSAAWIQTEYNNQSSPSTFYTVW